VDTGIYEKPHVQGGKGVEETRSGSDDGASVFKAGKAYYNIITITYKHTQINTNKNVYKLNTNKNIHK
jgi:hypothetical protein